MRFKTLFAAPAAIAAVLVLPVIAPQAIGFTTAAQAETNVSFSIGTFYDDLAPHGSWVNYSNAYVFVPSVGPDWRPYTVGHWEYTERYGWLWVSEEPFGWATAHYGRWGRADDIGWYWVPGRRWAPAWVSWKRSDDYVAWAPLPPDDDVGVSVNISVGNIPDPYWNVVPARRFLEPNLRGVIIRDDRERIRIVERARPIGHVTIQNNIVVNNVIDVRYVERHTRRNVRPIRVREIDDPRRAGRRQGDAIAIFRGEAEQARDRRPREVRDIEEVRQLRAERRANRRNERRNDETAAPDDGSTAARGSDVETGTAQQRRQQRRNERQTGQQGEQDTAPGEATGSTTRPNRQQRGDEPQAGERQEDNAATGETRERPANRAERRRENNNADNNRQNTRQRRDNQQPSERTRQRRRQNAEEGARQETQSRRNRQEQPAERTQRRRQGAEQSDRQRVRRRASEQRPAAERQRRRQEARPSRERNQQAPAARQQRRGGDQKCNPKAQNC